MHKTKRFTVMDLFCGAGGLSLGFQRAGFELCLAIDKDNNAVETYRRNTGNHVYQYDLSNYHEQDFPDVDLIIGGPPCQGFSSAGLRKSGDLRNSLVSLFAQIVAIKQPAAFVFENVEGFLTAEGGVRLFELLTPLIQAGYYIHVRKINAANFGVPQHRKRVIIIGGLGWEPEFPVSTHSAFGAPGAHLAGENLIRTPVVGDALKDLPPASTEQPGIPEGHFYRPLQGLDLERALSLKPGQTMRDLPQELQHASYQRRANRRVLDGTPTERRGGAPGGVRRLNPDEPSKSITGGAGSEFLHPSENRSLTIRECARLQSFPDDFMFYGNQSVQMQLIGNAVPPLFAEAIASRLLNDLSRNSVQAYRPGKLLSFVPTLSTGFSPVLRKVTDDVLKTFRKDERSITWD